VGTMNCCVVPVLHFLAEGLWRKTFGRITLVFQDTDTFFTFEIVPARFGPEGFYVVSLGEIVHSHSNTSRLIELREATWCEKLNGGVGWFGHKKAPKAKLMGLIKTDQFPWA